MIRALPQLPPAFERTRHWEKASVLVCPFQGGISENAVSPIFTNPSRIHECSRIRLARKRFGATFRSRLTRILYRRRFWHDSSIQRVDQPPNRLTAFYIKGALARRRRGGISKTHHDY